MELETKFLSSGEEYQKERLGVYTQLPELEEDGYPVYGK